MNISLDTQSSAVPRRRSRTSGYTSRRHMGSGAKDAPAMPFPLPLLVGIDADMHHGRTDGVGRPLQPRDDALNSSRSATAGARGGLTRALPSLLVNPAHPGVELGILDACPTFTDDLSPSPGLGRRAQWVSRSPCETATHLLRVSRG